MGHNIVRNCSVCCKRNYGIPQMEMHEFSLGKSKIIQIILKARII